MKRFPDLDREILLAVEADDYDCGILDLSGLGGHSEKQIGYQVGLLGQQGLLKVIDRRTDKEPFDWRAAQLTAAGHEHLDAIRDPETWRRAKEGARRIGDFSLETLGTLARAVIRERIKRLTGGEFEF